jgi:hypothetical protein
MNKLRLIFVHGISASIVNWDYSAALRTMMTTKLIETGVIPESATEEEIEEFVTFEHVNYSAIGHEEEERLFNVYERETAKLYNFVYRLSKVSGLDKVRRQIITSVGDVMVYLSDYWGEQIRGMLLEKINPYVGSGDAVSLVAHSLGSVVAFDTLYYNIRTNPEWQAARFKPTNLFTMGSPLALFSMDLDRETGTQKQKFKEGAEPEMPDIPDSPALKLLQDYGVWYNFLDAQDIIAYPLGALFEGKFDVEDVVVQTGTNPRKAHDGYWENQEIVDVISARLKMDFQRINTSDVPQEAVTQA